MNECFISGVTYESVEVTEADCKGCAGFYSDEICRKLPFCMPEGDRKSSIIWIKKEEEQ